MFLDDQLYRKVKFTVINTPDDFEGLVNALYKICEEYYKPKLPPLLGCSYKDVTQLMNKTFRFWDMFIEKLEKEDWFLIDVLKNCSYKNAYMSHPQLKELYEKGI